MFPLADDSPELIRVVSAELHYECLVIHVDLEIVQKIVTYYARFHNVHLRVIKGVPGNMSLVTTLVAQAMIL